MSDKKTVLKKQLKYLSDFMVTTLN